MFGKTDNSQQRIELQREMSKQYNIIIVLKGANTSITFPNGSCFFNSTGNPGMATAGSGDVLTGIILSLLAQRYTPEEAAIIGVFMHGRAGDKAAAEKGMERKSSGCFCGDRLCVCDFYLYRCEHIPSRYSQLRVISSLRISPLYLRLKRQRKGKSYGLSDV